jgi:flagellar protein FliL
MAKKPKKPEGEEEGDAKPAKSGGIAGLLKNRIVIGVLGLAIIGGGGAFAAMKMGFIGGGEHHDEAGAEHAAAEPAAEKKPVSFVDLPEMMVNLDSKDRPQYLKVKIALEVGEEKMSADIQPMMPRVLDTFQTYMRQLRPTDLEGSAGLFRLKEELTRRVNVAVYPAKVDAVLFKEIVVQ